MCRSPHTTVVHESDPDAMAAVYHRRMAATIGDRRGIRGSNVLAFEGDRHEAPLQDCNISNQDLGFLLTSLMISVTTPLCCARSSLFVKP